MFSSPWPGFCQVTVRFFCQTLRQMETWSSLGTETSSSLTNCSLLFFLCKSFFWLLHRLRKHNTNSIFKTWSAAERARGWKVALHKTPGIRHCLFPSSERGDERWIDYFGKKNSVMWILTSEGNCALRKARVFCFPEAEQGGGEQRVIDEILHVVALTFLFGFRAHLICHILPVGQKWHRHKKYRPCVQTLWERVWINKPGYKYFRCNS